MLMISRKGISPLVAAVVLIVFTLSVAGILAGWMINYAKTIQTKGAATTAIAAQCIGADLTLINKKWENGNLTVTLKNTGSIPLKYVTASCHNPSCNVVSGAGSVNPGGYITIKVNFTKTVTDDTIAEFYDTNCRPQTTITLYGTYEIKGV